MPQCPKIRRPSENSIRTPADESYSKQESASKSTKSAAEAQLQHLRTKAFSHGASAATGASRLAASLRS